MHELDLLMRENPHNLAFKKLNEIENQQKKHALAQNTVMLRVNMVLCRECNSDNQRYNLTTSNETTMVFQNDDDHHMMIINKM